ncbi:hypothetical protein H3H36_13900 [Duganella sp. FT3S]|uniref:Uncharacterized protein n=1 Tax=Rugamonas fusca TaxID=2758568 RepID=A0A7W2EIK1_9BURK|nr:hypothetical protein [Rugamonas fusca]MBA5606447.1 hypothetical protein [Rugamonas fusca]
MTLHQFLRFSLAMVIAYGTVLLVPLLVDYTFDTRTEYLAIIWLNVGLAVMRLKQIPFPLPDMGHIDVGGGLRVLWWALFWPSYLLPRK